MVNFHDVRFVVSAYQLDQLPAEEHPEIAFAGRSNVGKSSLLNRLMNRRNLVKVSARPGKTQSLNFYLADQNLYLVDLPGYGFARVNKNLQEHWQRLVTGYLENRETLRCVVVVIDIRHEPKRLDRQLVDWLKTRTLPFLLVYTKSDKLSANRRARQAAALDAGFGVAASDRVVFSAKTGFGRQQSLENLDHRLG